MAGCTLENIFQQNYSKDLLEVTDVKSNKVFLYGVCRVNNISSGYYQKGKKKRRQRAPSKSTFKKSSTSRRPFLMFSFNKEI